MRSSVSIAALVLGLTSSLAAAETLAIVTPCDKGCPTSMRKPPMYITKQHQPVPTCVPKKDCGGRPCKSNEYEESSYNWVSTKIPCATPGGYCIVTDEHQMVPISTYESTATTYIAAPTGGPKQPKTVVMVIVYKVEYSKLGPKAFEGYPGNDLCKDCGPDSNGGTAQPVTVHECQNKNECVDYKETWFYHPTETTSEAAEACKTDFYAPTNGVYTIPYEHSKHYLTTTVDNSPKTLHIDTTTSYMKTYTTDACETSTDSHYHVPTGFVPHPTGTYGSDNPYPISTEGTNYPYPTGANTYGTSAQGYPTYTPNPSVDLDYEPAQPTYGAGVPQPPPTPPASNWVPRDASVKAKRRGGVLRSRHMEKIESDAETFFKRVVRL